MAKIMSKGFTLELDGANVGVEQVNLIKKEECKQLDNKEDFLLLMKYI